MTYNFTLNVKNNEGTDYEHTVQTVSLDEAVRTFSYLTEFDEDTIRDNTLVTW